MQFLLPRKLAPGGLAPTVQELDQSTFPDVELAVKLADFFEQLIFTLAHRRDPAGDHARRALRLMGPDGDPQEAARMLQPFAAGFAEWLRSGDDVLTVEVPKRAKPRINRAN